jgi:hypothetical protein
MTSRVGPSASTLPPRHDGARADLEHEVEVVGRDDVRVLAHCMACHETEALISGWEGTMWAEGMMPPAPLLEDPGSGEAGGNGTPGDR